MSDEDPANQTKKEARPDHLLSGDQRSGTSSAASATRPPWTRFDRVNVALPLVLGAMFVAMGAQPSGLLQLGLVGAVLLFPALALINLFLLVRQRNWWRAGLVLAVWFIAIPASCQLGRPASRLLFELRRPELEAEVERVRELTRADSSAQTRSSIAYAVHAYRSEPDGLQIDFFYGRGFPAKHSAYVYTDPPEAPDLSSERRWYRCSPLGGPWWDCSD